MKNIIFALLVAAAAGASAQSAPPVAPAASAARLNPQDANYEKPERGWFFFEGKKKEEPKEEPREEAPQLPSASKDTPPVPKEKKCSSKDTWAPDCGFVNPGTDFEFQAKQRDALMERMVVSQNDPKAVEAFQYYMRWVMERTSEVSNLWYYNMVQNPDLDPSTKNPVSAFGLRLMTDVQKGKESEISRLLKEEGAALIYFSRSDCQFCHQMARQIRDLGTQLKVPVLNASLDDKCMPGFEEGCKTQPATLPPAQALQVTTVPTVFLYVPKNSWIRIATGITDTESMKTRAMQFFLAYRTALLKGVNNGQEGRSAVDFSKNDDFMSGQSQGVEAGQSKLPTEGDIAKLLGQQK